MTHQNTGIGRIILASASPRRAELLTQAGYVFEVIHPPFQELDEMGPDVPPEARAEALSYFKARSVAKDVKDGLIIAADTVVDLDGAVFGKPIDVEDAKRILESLSGSTHKVISGLTLLNARTRRRMIRHDTTTVKMRPMPPAAMEKYLASNAWAGKAGAYGIQDQGVTFIERIDGSFTNVVGLPMELLARMLAKWGYDPIPLSSSEPESV